MHRLYCAFIGILALHTAAVGQQAPNGNKENKAEEKTNNEKTYQTRFGTFRIVWGFGGYTTDPTKGHIPNQDPNDWGTLVRCDSIQDPAGRWHRGFPLDIGSVAEITDLGEHTFMIADGGVYRYKSETGFIQVFELNPDHASLSKIAARGYYAQSSNQHSIFLGLVRYDEAQDKWSEIQYTGPRLAWVDKSFVEGNKLTMKFPHILPNHTYSTDHLDTLVFDLKTLRFSDPVWAEIPGEKAK